MPGSPKNLGWQGRLGLCRAAWAAEIHLLAAMPNLGAAADSHYHHLTDDILVGGKLQYARDGTMLVPKGPGLGVDLDRDKLAKHHELAHKQQTGSWVEDPPTSGVVTVQPKW